MSGSEYDLGFWAKLGGMLTVLTSAPFATLKATTISKKEFKVAQETCQDKIHVEIQAMKGLQEKQTAWIIAIASATGVKKEDVREL